MAKTMNVQDLRELVSKVPRVHLTDLPTPLQECPHLAEALGGKVRIFMKRDDLTTPGMGGNKIRKLEFIAGEIKAEGYDVVVHGLAGQSNYCRQTAAVAAKLGLPCHLILRKDHKAQDPAQGNRLLDYVFGAKVRMVERAEQQAAKQALVEELKSQGRKPYLVGHHDEILGAVAYSLCLAEIIEQQAAHNAAADYVCVAGQSGTQAGLVIAKRLLGFEGEILGFNPGPAPDDEAVRAGTAGIATEAASLLGLPETFSADDFDNTSRFSGKAYGSVTGECLDAILLVGSTEGVLVGPVYTAKAIAGMIDYIKSGRIKEGSTIVFLHTGGTPETFAYNTEIVERVKRSV